MMRLKRGIVVTLLTCLLLASSLSLAQGEGEGAGAGQGNSAESKAKVKNLPPQVTAVTLDVDDDPSTGGAQVDPTPGETRTFGFVATVQDRNNHQDVTDATCTLSDPAGAQVSDHATTGMVPGSGQGKRADWAFQASIPYDATPGTWTLDCGAQDGTMKGNGQAPGQEDRHTATFEVRELAAIRVADAQVDFTGNEPVEPGVTTTPASVAVENMGNVRVDLQVGGQDLAGPEGASIGIDRVSVATGEDMADGQALSASGVSVSGFDLDAGQGNQKPVWFQLVVPTGDEQFVPPGAYTGQVTISAQPDSGS